MGVLAVKLSRSFNSTRVFFGLQNNQGLLNKLLSFLDQIFLAQADLKLIFL
jgi:hypothetical protein